MTRNENACIKFKGGVWPFLQKGPENEAEHRKRERGCRAKIKPKEQNYSKTKRLKNQIVSVVTNPYNIIVVIAVILLTYLIVLPLLDMLSTTFSLAQRDLRAVPGGVAGEFTFYYWKRLLASILSMNLLVKPLINS